MALIGACALAAALHRVALAEDPSQLVHVAGNVQYALPDDRTLHPVFGQIDLPLTATAVTLEHSQGLVRLADSSEVDIGARTRVRLASLAAAAGERVVVLEVGALHFTVRHPAGQRSNYRFITPTAQIAVRGTEGYIVTGPGGTDVYCARCGTGDVEVTVDGARYPMITGVQLFVFGRLRTGERVSIVDQPCVNPAAIAISAGALGRGVPDDLRYDTTGATTADPLIPVAVEP